MPRSFINDLKQHDIVGLIPASQKFDIEETKKAYDALLNGEEYFTDIVIQYEPKSSKRSQSTIKLTTRQSQILDLISHRGLSNKKIAQHLKISESTVKVHMSAILKAYGVRNRTQLALAGGRGLTA
jgi:DNA-binding NarL/FixJ family response regulator